MKKLRIAIVGATGAIGRELTSLLIERNLSLGEPQFYATSNSIGEEINFKEFSSHILNLEEANFSDRDVVFFTCPKDIAVKYIPSVVKSGAWVIDGTSATSDMAELIVPEINGINIKKVEETKIIVSPDCASIQLAMVIHAVKDLAKVKSINTTVLHSASYGGRSTMDKLFSQTTTMLGGNGESVATQMAFNCLPQVGTFNGADTTSELAIVKELPKLIGCDVNISATCVQVPTFIGCAQSVTIEFSSIVEAKKVRLVLENMAGIIVIDDPKENKYSTPLGTAETDPIYISRIRTSDNNPALVSLWIASDNLRKGGALNMVHIAETLANIK